MACDYYIWKMSKDFKDPTYKALIVEGNLKVSI